MTVNTSRWQPGQSGNPSGRPPGTSRSAHLRESISLHIPEIVDKLVAAAKDGDVQAARLLMERVLPPVKPVEEATPVDLPSGTLTEQGRAVVNAIAAGDLSPTQGSALLASLGSLAKLAEADELERRIEALEARTGKGGLGA